MMEAPPQRTVAGGARQRKPVHALPPVPGALESAFPPEVRDALELEMGTHTREHGERIQSRDEPSRGLYLIRSGIVRFTNPCADGREIETARLGAGAWFGHIGLLSGLPPSHEARALGRTRLGMLPAARFHYMVAHDPELASSLLGHLATSLHGLFSVLDDLRSPSSRAKVAKWLLTLEAQQGFPGRIELDQETLAAQLGLTRVTVGKVLRTFAEAGAVRQGYGWIEIVDPKALS